MEARMKAMHEFAMADPENCDKEWDAYLALVSNQETASISSPTASTSSLHNRVGASAATATASSAPAAIPTTTAASRTVLSAEHDSPKDDLSPGARRIYDYIVGNSAKPPTTDVSTNFLARTELDVVHGADEDPAAPTSTTCSTICLRADTSATSTPSSTVASSAPTTASAVIVPAASMGPAASVLLEDGGDLSSTPPLVCLIMWPSGGICTVASEPCSIKPNFVQGVSDFSLMPAAYLVDDVDITAASPTKLAVNTPLHLSSPSPTSTTAALLSADGFTIQMLMCALSLATEIKRPWPPPCYVRCQEGNMCKDMLQSLLLDGFILHSMQLMLWAGKYRWPPPTPNRSKACRISNLESTMEIEWNTTLSMCTFTPGVQRAQQQPTMFKWSDLICHDTYWLIASTKVDKRLDFLFARQATCTLWTWYYLHNLHCSPGSNNFAITDWALPIISLETWLLLSGDSASVKIQRSITVQQSTMSSGFLASLEGVELKLWPALLVSIFVPSVQSAQLQPTVFRCPAALSNMTLVVASIVVSLRDTSLMTKLATPNGSCDYLEPVLRFIINLFSWSPHSKWPPISPNGPFQISADVHQEFMGIYSVTAVLPRLFLLVVMRTEEMLWPIFQFATGNMILLLPWDPGLPLSGLAMIMFSTPVYGLAVRLRSSTEVTRINKRILNRHSTLDKNMQLLVDCQVLKIWEHTCSAVPIVVTFLPGYQKAQLKPTLSKWSIPSCLVRQFLGASTLYFLLARRGAHIVWNWCCLDYLHCYLVSANWALEEEHRQVLLQIPWQSVGYHWEAAYSMKPCSAIHKLFIIVHWLIPWEPGDDSSGSNLMENLDSLVTTCELLYSVSLNDKLLADRYWLWCMNMKNVELPRVRPEAYFSLPLQGDVCSTSIFLANVNGDSEVQHQCTCRRVLMVADRKGCIYHHIQRAQWEFPWTISLVPLKFWFQCCCAGHESLYNGENFQWTIAWSLSYPVPSVDHALFSLPGFFHMVRYPDEIVGITSQSWIIYLPGTYIMQCGFELMPWGIAYSRNGILTYTKQVLISWDPGGSVPVLDTGVNWNSTPLPWLRLTWNPGDSTRCRLEGKPDFKKGGLSTTYLYKWADGPYIGLCPAEKAEAEEAWMHIYLQSGHSGTRLGTNGTDGLGLEGEDRLECGVCHLLPLDLSQIL